MLDFLIMYEHKNREINSDCLLKAELERRGYTVKIENTVNRQLFRYHLFEKPKVIVVISLYNEKLFYGHVTDMVGYHRKVVNLQWEQIGDLKSRGKLLTPSGLCKDAVHICWGEKRAKYLQENGCKNAIATGPIQMDFLRPAFSTFYISREKLHKEYGIKGKKVLLYVSSFSYVHMKKEDKERLAEMTGLNIQLRIEEAEEAQNKTIDILETYLKNHKDESIIYRPHPGEYIIERLQKLEREESNFFIISDYSIQQWIQTSDIIISWISTSIAEIYFAKKQCVILQPTVAKSWDDVLYRDARIVRNYIDFIEEVESDSYTFPIPEKNISANYGTEADGFAYKKIADLLVEIYSTHKYDMPNYKRGLYINAPFRRFAKSVIDKLRIKDTTFPFSKIAPVRDWLKFYWDYRRKTDMDLVSDDYIQTQSLKLREIVDKL